MSDASDNTMMVPNLDNGRTMKGWGNGKTAQARLVAGDGERDYSILSELPATFWGERSKDAKRVGFLSRPTLGKVADRALEAFAAQARSDHDVMLSSGHMNPDGLWLAGAGANAVPPSALTTTALSQLMSKIRAPKFSGAYLGACPQAMRADHVNHWSRTYGAKTPGEGTRRARTMRHPETEGGRLTYAIVTEGYSRCDADQVIKALLEVAPGGARAMIGLDGPSMVAEISWMDLEAKSGGKPDGFMAGIKIRLCDDGTGGIAIMPWLGRLVCTNGMTIRIDKNKIGIAHRGDMQTQIREAMTLAINALEGFPKLWADAAKDSILDGVHELADPSPLFRALIANDLITVPGNADEAVARFASAWHKEPGYTRTDLINAITRAAHENTWTSPWVQTNLEEQAGELLYQKVLYTPNDDGGALRFGALDMN